MLRWWTVLAAALLIGWPARAQDSVYLGESLRAGSLYKISTRVELHGTLFPPAEKGKAVPAPIKLEGSSAMDYEERIETLGADSLAEKAIRLCQRMEVERTMAGQLQQNVLRPAVRRLVIMREKQVKAPFSPDGPLTWSEIDLVRTDIFLPLLMGLLPAKESKIGDRWRASPQAVQELTGLEKLTEGGLDCVLASVQTRGGRRQARVDFSGTVRGTNEDGAGQQRIDGHFLFDLEASALTFVALTGTHSLVGPDGKEGGRIEGRFALHRQVVQNVPGLSDEALRGLDTVPSPDNTQLLFDNGELGVKFVYPRRWHLASVKGLQITLDTPQGNGLLITLEPEARMPTAQAYQKETREWIEKQRGQLRKTYDPRSLQTTPTVEYFGLEVELGGQAAQMDYYLCRQTGGGALLAARLNGIDHRESRLEVEKIARSVRLTKKIEGR